MAYNPVSDFVGLWRNNGLSYSKLDVPGLDFVVAALGRSGLITVTVSASAPLANQDITAWYQPATPSYSAEGTMHLWNASTGAYAPATMALLWDMLQVAAGASGISWWVAAGGPPANTVGNNGDLALRTDFPGGIYGPKAAGAWPASPIPGTTYAVDSTALDTSFGTAEGNMLYRSAVNWLSLPIGANGTVLRTNGVDPAWSSLSAILDLIGGTRGMVLYRGAAAWAALAPGTAGYNLTAQGAGADPAWTVPGAEFGSGTVMVFRQTAAPTNWTKQTANNDCGLRVTSGSVGSGGSSAFSSVFAQTAVGNTTLTTATMPGHVHSINNAAQNGGVYAAGGGTGIVTGVAITQTGAIGGDGAHAHSINLTLAYIDVIIATKN